MKPRTPPQQVATRSKSALEAMCVAVVRRLDGLAGVRHVEVLPLEAEAGCNWQVGSIEIEPPLDEADRQKVEDALAGWRQRFRLS
jgi:hypothetical protein